jgi:hypothetical protein
MAFTAAEIMRRGSTTLVDPSAVRWTAQEMRDYINEGVRAIIAMKPNAASVTATLALASGTRQVLPVAYTVLARVMRNTVSGQAVTSLDDTVLLDQHIPGWRSATVIPFHKDVTHIIQDPVDLRVYHVLPGNDGSGQIDVIVGQIPTDIPLPGAPNVPANYITPVGLPDIYQDALVNFLLYKAYSKDAASPNAQARATAHYTLFDGQVKGIAEAETAMSLAGNGGV